MKTIFSALLIIAAITVTTFSSCQKENPTPNDTGTVQVLSDPCDTCAFYCVSFSIQNPDHIFKVFLDSVEVVPFSDNFQACTGQVIRLAMTQDCVANGRQCSQWQVEIMRDGTNIHNITGEGSYLSHLYTIP